MTLKSIRPDDWPERIHVHKAVVRFPNGIESGNWQTKPDDDTCEYVRALPPAPDALTVWYGSMPESNGRQNWTAMLYRKGSRDRFLDGFCFARSEYPNRVQYEADRMRWVIGELPDRPDILAYDDKAHSGYVDPAPDAVEALVKADSPAVDAWIQAASTGLTGDLRQDVARGLNAALAAIRAGGKE